jgi:hypothetical protein
MKIKVGDAHNLLTVLMRLDSDASLKVEPEIRLALAININRLRDDMAVYERARLHLTSKFEQEAAEAKRPLDQVALFESDDKLREAVLRVKLLKIQYAGLDVKKNGITGLAALAPIISDFDTAFGSGGVEEDTDDGGDSETTTE